MCPPYPAKMANFGQKDRVTAADSASNATDPRGTGRMPADARRFQTFTADLRPKSNEGATAFCHRALSEFSNAVRS